MAKHFTDTRKWEDPWFFSLSPELKLAWLYICDNCDGAGVWKVNMALLNISITGTRDSVVDLAALEHAFGKRIIRVKDDSVWIPQFIKFQYKNLSPRSAPARGLMRKIVEATEGLPLSGDSQDMVAGFRETLRLFANPKPTPSQGLTNPHGKGREGKGGEGRGEEGEGNGEGEGQADAAADISRAYAVWRETLTHFGIKSFERPAPAQELVLSRSIRALGLEIVLLALEGQRYEPATEKFNPKAHLSIERVLNKNRDGKTRWEQLMNLALEARGKREAAARGDAERKARSEIPADEAPADPEKIRAMALAITKNLRGGA